MSKKLSIVAVGLGAGLMYFFDPDQGTRRRHIARDRLGGAKNKAVRTAEREAAYVGGQVQGVVKEMVHTPRDNPNPDDNTLTDRVESEVFRDQRVPKGKLNVNVVEGVVELRGQLDNQNDIDYVVQLVKKVPDVKGIHNYLHLPGTPAPNKEAAVEAS